ncbi:MAG: diguanylate cyclase [Rubellimicrobium sp.]|nr:diguanylate cyclase [Rubellimicrobium sp.]
MTEQEKSARRRALMRYDVLENGPEEEFEQIIVLAKMLFSTPMAAVTLVDGQRQWIKGQRGLMMRHGAMDLVFNAYTLESDRALCVEDALNDKRFASDPLVAGPPGLRSYVGAPLVTPEGMIIGAVCAIDTVRRDFSEVDAEIMEQLARIAVGNLELRLIASKDVGTGAESRRAFMDILGKQLERHRRSGARAVLATCRIVGLGQVILGEGLEAADAVLAEVAAALDQVLRKTDFIGRVGNDTFGVLLVDAGLDEAMIAIDRFSRAIAKVRSRSISAVFGISPASQDHATAADWLRAVVTDVDHVGHRPGRQVSRSRDGRRLLN